MKDSDSDIHLVPDVVHPPAQTAAAVPAIFGGQENARLWSSFPLDTPEARARAVNALNAPDNMIRAVIGKTIWVKEVVAADTEWTDKTTGELIQAVMTVLICVDGHQIGFVGMTARQGLGRIMASWPLPWPEGIPIIVTRSQGLAGHNRDSVTIDLDAWNARKEPKKPAKK